jgi:hypothetical protein
MLGEPRASPKVAALLLNASKNGTLNASKSDTIAPG